MKYCDVLTLFVPKTGLPAYPVDTNVLHESGITARTRATCITAMSSGKKQKKTGNRLYARSCLYMTGYFRAVLQQVHRVCRNHQLFVGGDYDNRNFRVGSGYHSFLTVNGAVFLLVEFDAHPFHVLADFFAHR